MTSDIMRNVSDQSFDEERALYNLKSANVVKCSFEGPADGESALKEARNVNIEKCKFALRYPMWHVNGFTLSKSTMESTARAALWYSAHGKITDTFLGGIKALRECESVNLHNCKIDSAEFGWKCRKITLTESEINAEYLFLDSFDIKLSDVAMKGKYSFQYINNLEIENCNLDTKDAFWHSKNITVRNSVVKGEYLGWFSDNLTLIDCKIIGTQPLCYCTNLKLINCTMEDTDLAFEYSDVEASIVGNVISIKNPKSGTITVDSVGEIITDNPVMECNGKVVIRK